MTAPDGPAISGAARAAGDYEITLHATDYLDRATTATATLRVRDRPPAVHLPPGADPALSYPRPDIENIVHHAIKPFGGTITWAYSAGDGQPRGWQYTANVQVDVRAHRKSAAFARADACRRAICALPWAMPAGGVITRVDVTDGPYWLPDENGAPRYVARYAVSAHPWPRTAPTEVETP